MKRIIILLLAAVTFLSGCSNYSNKVSNNPNSSDNTKDGDEERITIYKESPVSFPAGTKEYVRCQGNSFYLIFQAPFFYSVSDGNRNIYDVNKLFCSIGSSENYVWLLENDTVNDQSSYYLSKISPTTKELLSSFSIEQISGETKQLPALYSSNSCYLLINIDNEKLLVLHELGNFQCQIELPVGYNTWYFLETSDKMFLVGRTIDNDTFYYIDNTTWKITKIFSCEAGFPFYCSDKDQVMVATDAGIYVIDENGSSTLHTNWSSCNISISSIHCIQPLGLSKYLLHNSGEFKILIPLKTNAIPAKKKIVLASLDSAYGIQTLVASFNSSNEEYYVAIKDYSDNGLVDKETALLRFNTDIISGLMPDLIYASSISPYPLIRKGLLADITEYVKHDEDVSEENISIRKALEWNGSIYLLGSGFSIETLEGKFEIFGERYGWTFEDYLKLQSDLPDDKMIIYNMTMDTIVDYMLPRYAKKVINWDTATCDFNNQQFVQLLEQGKKVKKTPEDQYGFLYGDSIAMVGNDTLVTSLSMINRVWSFAADEKKAGCKLSPIGWPTVDGSCGSDIYLTNPVGMINSTAFPEGCWQFLKYIMMNGNEEKGLSIFKPVLDAKIEDALRSEDLPLKFTEEDAKRFMNFIQQIDNVRLYDNIIQNIIKSECIKFINGQYSAEETARIIQSKVSLYMAEQS